MAITDTTPTIDQPLGSTVTTEKPAKLSTHNTANIQERLNKALDSKESRNRSSDLVPLTQNYEALRKNLLRLIEAAKVYHDSLGRTSDARLESMESFNKVLKGSPLESIAISDMTVQHQLVNKNREMSQRYKRDIIDYLEELDHAISTRVTTEQKQVHELHDRLLHYEKKIEKLRKTVGAKETKANTEVPKKKSDKLARNEDKLNRAWKLHEAKASRICDLLEEVTVNGWKDLYSVMGSIFEFEKDYNNENARITNELPALKMQLDNIYNEHHEKSMEGARNIPIALETNEAKQLLRKNEVHYDDNISLSSSNSSHSDTGDATGEKKHHGLGLFGKK